MNKLGPVFASLAVIVLGWVGYARYYASLGGQSGRVPVVHLPFDSKVIDLQIRNNEAAVRRDPYGALGWSMLAGAYMDRSRESDDLATAVKAEAAARRSLQLRMLGNVGAENKLVQTLLQQHRFKDALAECEGADRRGIYSDDTVVLRVECLIELGRYDEAGVLVAKNPRAFGDGPAKTVVARLLDVAGKPEEALKIYRLAVKQVDDNGGMPSNAVAWFHTRLGLQLAKLGKHDEARTEFNAALKMYPRDYKAMAGLAKLASQEGSWQEAVDWGNRSDEVAQMADVRALVGDAYAMLGEASKAEEQYGRVAELVGRPSGMNDGLHEVTPAAGTHGHRLDRQYAIFCADHDRDPVGAYAAAIRDFEARRDVYAYDTLAWVCFKTGNMDEAKKSIDLALVHGTRDPMLWYHAGEIYAAVGSPDVAANYLEDALGMDPNFDGIAAPKANHLLTDLKAKWRNR
jgi:tetratricopeptide (TPR) repeat protein